MEASVRISFLEWNAVEPFGSAAFVIHRTISDMINPFAHNTMSIVYLQEETGCIGRRNNAGNEETISYARIYNISTYFHVSLSSSAGLSSN